MKTEVEKITAAKREKTYAYIRTVGNITRLLYPHPTVKEGFAVVSIHGNHIESETIDRDDAERRLADYDYKLLKFGDQLLVKLEF